MRPHRILAAASGAAALALGGGALAAQSAVAASSAPVIHESFTPLPCTGKPANQTTLQMEGCAEHRVLTLDRRIDTLNATIFAELSTNRARRDLISANTGWLRFRRHSCLAVSENYAAGSMAPLVYANCLVTIDGRHVGELRALAKTLRQAG